MISARWVRLACVAALAVGLMRTAARGASAVEELAKRMPDDVVAFVGTSGGDVLKGDFEKTILGRICHDESVRDFCRSIKTELMAKAGPQLADPNTLQKIDMVLDYVRLALSRPIVIGAIQVPAQDGPPVAGFVILDAGDRKAQFIEAVGKLEAMIGPDEIADRKIGSFTMRGPRREDDGPLYWGWAGNRFVIALNDARGAAVKYLSQPRATAPAYPGRIPSGGDALVAYGDIHKISQFVREDMDEQQVGIATGVFKGLGLNDVKSLTFRAGFAGSDVVARAVVAMPAATAGILTALKPVDPSWFGAVDGRAMMVNAVNCDLGAVYDMVMGIVRTASPDEAYPELQQALSEFESQAGLRVREGLLASLAGPIVFYSLPAGATPTTPMGGGVLLARLKDAGLFEKSLAALGKFAMQKAEGQLQVSSQRRDDGRTVHFWNVGAMAMMGIMPTWSIANDHLVLGSNTGLHDAAAKRLVAKKADANSLLDSAGYQKAAAGLPGNLLTLTYTDSQAYFNQSMMQIQQFWPMVTMMAMKEGIRLPAMLPPLTQIATDMGPSINYSYFGPDGLHSVYRGPGFENNQMTIAGGALAMGVLMPALARTRQLAFRMTSGTNLSGIGRACDIYAEDHNGRLPPDLQTLVGQANLSSKALESKLKPEDFDGPSYIYIPGQDASMHPRNVVAYDNPEFCKEGVNVLFLDFHVEFMKPAEFRRVLEATYSRLKRPLPGIRFKGDEPDDGRTQPAGDTTAKKDAGNRGRGGARSTL